MARTNSTHRSRTPVKLPARKPMQRARSPRVLDLEGDVINVEALEKSVRRCQFTNDIEARLFAEEKPTTFREVCDMIHAFRDKWGNKEFWKLPYEEQIASILLITSAFNRMEGSLDEIKSAGQGMQSVTFEFKMRRDLLAKHSHLLA